ncbi:hypothetical protein FM037_14330 [Shewanella psychropiezotolerans]|uniref:Uncharacterized protein n=1 Tax=Shewanella psychropiezotolerans TaxID=2593655 RepID=A0ABX5WYM9_9GAMM|nr:MULTISPECIES: hypothetical protein [Shewanella]MPY23905.1 hypothetical protein [Shewanella sp. YLB-07]QDO84195.1 hypothetical protein FM037_14330 [Shewanella psychropiezotolerans]
MNNQRVNLSISTEKLTQLIQDGVLCAADFRCLDQVSKQKVWQMCLWCCSKKISCTKDCALSCSPGCASPTKYQSHSSIEQVKEITSQSTTNTSTKYERLL